MVFFLKPKRSVSKPDHKKAGKERLRHLVQPLGRGKRRVARMATPPDPAGVPTRWDGKPSGKGSRKGLGIRRLPSARMLRDIALGSIRRLQDGFGDGETFSLVAAAGWREAIMAARRKAREEGDSPTQV